MAIIVHHDVVADRKAVNHLTESGESEDNAELINAFAKLEHEIYKGEAQQKSSP